MAAPDEGRHEVGVQARPPLRLGIGRRHPCTPLLLVDRTSASLSSLAVVVAAILLTAIMLWIVADVVLRAIGVRGLTGTVAAASDAVVAISFLCIPYAVRNGGHIRSDVLVGRLPARLSRGLHAVSYPLGSTIFLFIAWSSWEPMVTSWSTGEYAGDGALRIPTAPLRTVVVLGATLMSVECFLAALRPTGVLGAKDD